MTDYAKCIPRQRGEEVSGAVGSQRKTNATNDRDADVVRLLMSRDERALSLVMTRYGRLLLQLSLRITGSTPDAEECVNDALLDLWNTVPPTEPPVLLSYVSVLVRRRAIDRVRYNAAGRRTNLAYYSTLEELEECLPDGNGEKLLDSLVIRGCMTDFVSSLGRTDREMFLMRYFRFLSNEEISLALGMRENAVATRLCRLRKRLREELSRHGIDV